jgi:hypothetical protein
MKTVFRFLLLSLLIFSLGFAARFPKGQIQFKNGDIIKVKRIEIQDDLVFYRYSGDNVSAMLSDIQWIKARGRFERTIGTITGGIGFLVVGGISAKVIQGRPEYAGTLTGLTLGTTAVTYLGGRLIGGLLDPWRKIYTAPIRQEE